MNTRTHTRTHSLCQLMLLTTPTSLSFLKESSLRTNNSLSHHFTIFSIHYPLSLSPYHTLIPSPLFSPGSFTFQLYCHHSLSSPAPIFLRFTLSLFSQCCIDFHKASVISPYLLIPTLTSSFSTSQGCFHFHGHPQSFSPSIIFLYLELQRLSQAHCLPPQDVFIINLFFYFAINLLQNWM